MVDRGAMSDVSKGPNGQSAAEQPDSRPEALEQRVQRLEDSVAALQDTRALEDRVAERVVGRLSRKRKTAGSESSGLLASTMPAALGFLGGQGDTPQPGDGASTSLRRPWLFWDTVLEARAMMRMFFDPRYRPTWLARVVPLVLVIAIATSWIWLPGTSLLHSGLMTLVDKTVDLVLAFFAFKILHREARRYREVIADSPIVPRS
jgi:hypothetical protein